MKKGNESNKDYLYNCYCIYINYKIRNKKFFNKLAKLNVSAKLLEEYTEIYLNTYGTEQEKEQFNLIKETYTYEDNKYSKENIEFSSIIFPIFIESKGNASELIEKVIEYRLSFYKAKSFVELYYQINATSEERKEYNEIISSLPKDYFTNVPSIYDVFCNKILSFKTIDEAVNYLINKNINLTYYTNNVFYYKSRNLSNLPQEEAKIIEDKLEIIKIHFISRLNETTEQNIKPKRKDVYKEFVIEYINGDIFYEDLLEKYGFKNKWISSYFQYIKKYGEEEELKKVFDNKLNKERELKHLIAVEKSKITVDMIKNGIVINGQKEKFTALDLYFVCKDLKITEFLNITKDDLGFEDDKILKTFLHLNTLLYHITNNEQETIILRKICLTELVVQKQYTFKINDVYVTPSLEEKEYVLEYLKERNIPITELIFNVAIKRYLQGILTDEIEVYDETNVNKVLKNINL